MWCRRSLTSRELEHLNTACAKKKAKAMASGGKGKHSHCERMVTKKTRVPCLNQVQHIRLELESSQKTIAFQLHSPTQAMGKGNWSTMLRAKRKWSFQCCGVVGSQLEDRRGSNGSNKLQKAADAVRSIHRQVCHTRCCCREYLRSCSRAGCDAGETGTRQNSDHDNQQMPESSSVLAEPQCLRRG